MKKILLFICSIIICAFNAQGAVRGENTAVRGKSDNITTSQKNTRTTTSRQAVKTVATPRTAKSVSVLTPRSSVAAKTTATRTSTNSRATVAKKAVNTTRAATESETRIGIAYEQCKTAFFTCMDQFCQLKNDSYRRCSCSNRVFDFQDIAQVYQNATDQLTEFTENLDVVGLTKEQAIAMKTASEGEDALTEDKSASKALLQAIMNSIKGGDTNVGGKYKDLNSITISADISNAFGMDDSGQIIASYNGATLYKAVYPKCRNAVQEDCNNASLQRAVNAYLMAIEQDCNTVESALQKQQKSLKASTHENSALLDLARVENRQKHNSDDIATCLTNVENAVLSEEVCGANYHKCLDYGQFIDVTTGAPITGVTNFADLGKLLTYKADTDINNQKLAGIQKNQQFVQFFENKTKKFAKDSLDKCREDADFVWNEYLNRALIDIYYAQQDKVKQIEQSCLDLVATCYDNQNVAIANAMANLTGDSTLLLKPAAISLTNKMCSDYIESCNAMFEKDVIQQYITTKTSTDSTSACRAVVQQCFDKFGGTGYNNFYYTQSGLFNIGKALDWFTLYEIDQIGNILEENGEKIIVSPCAQQLKNTTGCDQDKIEEIFGGFNKYSYTANDETIVVYSAKDKNEDPENEPQNNPGKDTTRTIRPTGIATEVYYKILDNLRNNCDGLGGYFVEYKYAKQYGYKSDDFCRIDSDNPNSIFYMNPVYSSERSLVYWYHFLTQENMCPSSYSIEVDTQSWGMCSCWENGGRRSKNGTIATCRPLLPTINHSSAENDQICTDSLLCAISYADETKAPEICVGSRSADSDSDWCQQINISSEGKVCPLAYISKSDNGDVIKCTKKVKVLEDETETEKDTEIETVNASVPKGASLR